MTIACVAPAASTVPSPPMLTTTSSRRSSSDGRARLGDAVERQGRAVRHGAADDHPVVVGVDQPDLAGHEDAPDVEVLAQRVGVEAAGGGGVDGVAGLDGQHQRKSSLRGVKVSRSTPGPSRSLQPWVTPDGHHEGVARPDLEGLVADGEAVAAGLDEGRLHVRVAVRQPLAALGEGELDQHDLGALGQNRSG